MKKIFLFLTAALFATGAWAATETTTNTGTTDTDVAMTSFTIKGTYVAGSGSGGADLPNNGIKVRLNKASVAYSATTWGAEQKCLEISVNDNYKLTAFTFYLTTNDKTKTAIIDGIYVDGAAYEGSYETTVPGYEATNCLQVDLTDIEATTAITIHFSTLNNSQGRLVCTATYEKLVECDDPEIAWATAPADGEIGDEDFVASVTTTPEDHAVTWTSSNTAAATVDNGTIHYVGAGSTTITASLTYTGDDYCKKTVSVKKDILIPIPTPALGENDLRWYYQTAVPSSSPDNGLTYSSQGTISGNGLYGVKLNSSGWAWFAKPAVAGKLRIGAYYASANSNPYEVNVYACSANGTKGDLINSLSIASAGAVSSELDIDADIEGIYIARKTSNEGALYFIEFIETPAVNHTVTINPNGGAYASTPEGWTYDDENDVYTKSVAAGSFDVPDGLTKTDYDLDGWKDNHNNAISLPITLDKDTTLVAQWVEHTLSSDATLSDLTIDGVTVEDFAAATIVYDVELPFGTSVVPTVAGVANSAYAKSVVVTQASSVNGTASVVVTAEDNSTKTYTINFTVAESKVIDLVWKTGQSACAVAGSQTTAIKSNDAKVSTYIKQITFDNVEGSGDNAAEGSSLNTGKKEGNTIIIQTQSGYLFTAMSFYGKIESDDAKCFISIDGGSEWTDLTSTSSSDATYCDVISNASTNDIRIKSNGVKGVWIRNMQLTIKVGNKTPSALDNTDASVKAVKRVVNSAPHREERSAA